MKTKPKPFTAKQARSLADNPYPLPEILELIKRSASRGNRYIWLPYLIPRHHAALKRLGYDVSSAPDGGTTISWRPL